MDVAHQQHDERGHERPRQDVRRDHREHHRFGEGDEQEARDARQEEHGHEHDADAERGHERRDADLAGADQDRLLELGPAMEVPLDVLDGHDRLVDQDPDGEREPAQRHQVEGLAHDLQRQDRRQDRQWNRERDDERAAPVAEEQQDHRGGERRRDQRLDDHALDRGFHEQ